MIHSPVLDLPLPQRRTPEQVEPDPGVAAGPQPFSSRGHGWIIGWGCALTLLALFVADFKTPATITTGALAVLPVGVAAWFLSRRALWNILALGVAAQVSVAALGGISRPTAAAAVSTLLVAAFVTRFAAESHATVLEMRIELQRLAIERDRARIRQDLHDGAVQTIIAVGMALDAVAAEAGAGTVSWRIKREVQTLDAVVADVRRYVRDLAPRGPGEPDLAAALGTLRSRFEAAAGLSCELTVDPAATRVPGAIAREIIHVVNEALSNAVRHGGATTAHVAVEVTGSVASVQVSDNGSGFDVTKVSLGDGIRGFALRTGAVGGDVQVESTPGAGSSVQVRMPLAGMRLTA